MKRFLKSLGNMNMLVFGGAVVVASLLVYSMVVGSLTDPYGDTPATELEKILLFVVTLSMFGLSWWLGNRKK